MGGGEAESSVSSDGRGGEREEVRVRQWAEARRKELTMKAIGQTTPGQDKL